MKFSEFVLLSRQYLHDLRKSDGTIITSATEDGIRWSSADLLSICKGAMQELLRTLTAYKLEAFVNSSAFYQFIDCEIDPTTGLISGLPESGLYAILRIYHPTRKKIYEPMLPDKFFSEYYFTQYVSATEAGVQDCYFTTVLDASTGKIITYSVPLFPEELSSVTGFQALIKKDIDSILSIGGSFATNDMPFSTIEDLMFDYVVKYASARSHDDSTLKSIVESINFKLGALKNELQRTS